MVPLTNTAIQPTKYAAIYSCFFYVDFAFYGDWHTQLKLCIVKKYIPDTMQVKYVFNINTLVPNITQILLMEYFYSQAKDKHSQNEIQILDGINISFSLKCFLNVSFVLLYCILINF